MTDLDEPEQTRPRFDDLFGDLFGLNIKAFRTLRLLLQTPSTVFVAARTRNWDGDAFTPSIRFALTLFTLHAFFSFFVAGDNTPVSDGFIEGFTMQEETSFESEEERVAFGRSILANYSVSYPFTMLFVHGLMAWSIRVWGKGTAAVERVRFYMLALIPGLSASFLLVLISPLTPDTLNYLGGGAVAIVALFDFFTAYRGGVDAAGRIAKITKAAVFAGFSFLASMLGFIVSIVASLIVIMIRGLGA
ncbi:MAG: hypothetical protein AAGH41_02645 [Pseudomonadota bacterium]